MKFQEAKALINDNTAVLPQWLQKLQEELTYDVFFHIRDLKNPRAEINYCPNGCREIILRRVIYNAEGLYDRTIIHVFRPVPGQRWDDCSYLTGMGIMEDLAKGIRRLMLSLGEWSE